MKIEEENSEEKRVEAVTPELSDKEVIAQMQEQIKALTDAKSQPTGTNETVEAITQLVNQLKEKPDSEKYGGENSYTRPEDIDPNDRLEEGVTFFSHQVAYIIADDKRDGHNVRTPFGTAIKFVYQSTKAVKHGNETRLHNLSAYTSFSKMEVEWIMKHKFYGTIFFSNHASALGTDAVKAGKLARIIIVLQRYDVNKIVRIAQGLGIPPNEDISVLRTVVANKMAEDEMEAEKQSNQVRVKEAIIEKDILTQPVE